MKAKKLFAGVSALVLTAAAAMPMTAMTENQNTAVEFSITPGYMITIPERITLEENEDTKLYENDLNISASDVYLKEGKQITVSVTSASEFNMKTAENDAEYLLPYTASTQQFGAITDKKNGGKVAEFNNEMPSLVVPVHFATDEKPKYAGDYSDAVVFTIAVTDIPKTQNPAPAGG